MPVQSGGDTNNYNSGEHQNSAKHTNSTPALKLDNKRNNEGEANVTNSPIKRRSTSQIEVSVVLHFFKIYILSMEE